MLAKKSLKIKSEKFIESELWLYGALGKGIKNLNQELLTVSKNIVPSLKKSKIPLQIEQFSKNL